MSVCQCFVKSALTSQEPSSVAAYQYHLCLSSSAKWQGLPHLTVVALRRGDVRIRIRSRVVRVRVSRPCIRTIVRVTACQTNSQHRGTTHVDHSMRCKSMKIRHSILNFSKNDFKKNSTDGHRPSVAYRPITPPLDPPQIRREARRRTQSKTKPRSTCTRKPPPHTHQSTRDRPLDEP